MVARVVPDVTGLDKQFDYLVPDAWRGDVRAGTIVRVGLAGRRVGGWVVAVGPPDPDVPAAKLRPLAKVTGHGPSAGLIGLAAWASRRWAAGRLRPFLLAASPPRAVPALPAPAMTAGRPEPVDAGATRLLADGPWPVTLARGRSLAAGTSGSGGPTATTHPPTRRPAKPTRTTVPARTSPRHASGTT